MSDDDAKLKHAAAAVNVGGYCRHVLQCIGPRCCTDEQGQESWEYLKRRLKELGSATAGIYRTKVSCLRICTGGPIAVVYPDGAWYSHVTPEIWDRIIEEHLIRGQPLEEYCFARNPLPARNSPEILK